MGCSALRRPATWLAAGGALFLLAAPAIAQPKAGPKIVTQAVDPALQQRIRGMREGREAVSAKDLDVLAKWLVYRMTYPQAYDPKAPGYGANQAIGGITIEPINRLVQAAQQYILDYPLQPSPTNRLSEGQLQYQREFGRLMVERLKELLGHREPIVRANAAWLLGLLGRSGYENLADTYLEILASHDARGGGEPQKYFALIGLRALLAIRTDTEAPAGTVFKDYGRYCKVVKALIAFIHRQPIYAPDASPEEVNGFRWVRQAAVRALAEVRPAVVRNPVTVGAVDSMPAVELMKVALNDGLVPEPNLGERVDAVVGFCNMTTDQEEEIDYAVDLVGQFLRELAIARRAGLEPTTLPWKVTGARLMLALETWKKEVSNLPQGRGPDKVTLLADRANADLLSPLQKGDLASLNPDGIDGWLKAHPPKAPGLIRNQPGSKVTLGGAAKAAPAAAASGAKK